MQDITDYFLRSTNFRENNYLVVSKNKSPQELLSFNNKECPIPGEAIIELLKNSSYASNTAIEKDFFTFIKETFDYGIEGSLSIINNNDKEFFVDGLAVFKGNKMIAQFSNNDAMIFNLLRSSISKPLFTIKINNKPFSIVIFDAKTKFNINTKEINILGKYQAKIFNNGCNLNIKDPQVIKKINNEISLYLNKNIKNFIEKCQNNNSDILGLGKLYYIKYRIKNNSLWQNAKINSNITVYINKKGLAYKEYYDN